MLVVLAIFYFLDQGDKNRIFASNIYQYYSLEVDFSTGLYIRQ